jgi:Pyruvate/2-oxoacid:ferredoxin oxidoreductase delta subunit
MNNTITVPQEIQPLKVYGGDKQNERIKKTGLAVFAIGILLFFLSLGNRIDNGSILYFLLAFGLTIAGGLTYFIPQVKESPPGIKHNKIFFNSVTKQGVAGWVLGIIITGFYVVLYWFPEFIQGWIKLVDPLSYWLQGKNANRWFLYGTFYTVSVVVMGIRMIIKYRHNRYQIIRTISVSFFQLGFAFLIPAFLTSLNKPDYYFSYFWPLKYDYLFPRTVSSLISNAGALGYFMVIWGAVMTFIATPVLTYYFGKRWYCSWVCGCGGLAETLGDPWRQLSDKSLKAWKIERISIYSVLIFVGVTTSLLWINSATEGAVLGSLSKTFASIYGFAIGAVFAGVIGVGFYPIFGSRVWCRFGCPMAAILGIIQKYFSRFRITVNGDQCISCGNCSTYCEMGIDVKWYAQRGQNIIRASCVGCGVCSAVCPRGVLNLENGPVKDRYNLD